MLYLTLKRKRYALPTSWKEMTPDNSAMFIRMSSFMQAFEAGNIDFEAFKIGLVFAILGIRKGKVSRLSEEFSENIFRLSEQLSFPYRLIEKEDGRTVCELTLMLSDNLIPAIGRTKGYTFHYEPSGHIDCNLTAERYIDTLSFMQAWQNTRQMSALESLAKTLYPGIKRVPEEFMIAAYYNFRGILSWIKAIPAYELIFTAPDRQDESKNPVGLASSIYALSKAGYGSIDNVKDLPLFDYLDLLLQQSIDSIRALAATQMKPVQIAERLGLPTELVLPYTK